MSMTILSKIITGVVAVSTVITAVAAAIHYNDNSYVSKCVYNPNNMYNQNGGYNYNANMNNTYNSNQPSRRNQTTVNSYAQNFDMDDYYNNSYFYGNMNSQFVCNNNNWNSTSTGYYNNNIQVTPYGYGYDSYNQQNAQPQQNVQSTSYGYGYGYGYNSQPQTSYGYGYGLNNSQPQQNVQPQSTPYGYGYGYNSYNQNNVQPQTSYGFGSNYSNTLSNGMTFGWDDFDASQIYNYGNPMPQSYEQPRSTMYQQSQNQWQGMQQKPMFNQSSNEGFGQANYGMNPNDFGKAMQQPHQQQPQFNQSFNNGFEQPNFGMNNQNNTSGDGINLSTENLFNTVSSNRPGPTIGQEPRRVNPSPSVAETEADIETKNNIRKQQQDISNILGL